MFSDKRQILTQRRFGVTACGAVLTLACLAGCGGGVATGSAATDAEKRAAIDAMYLDYREDFPEVEDISAEALAALRDTEAIVLVDGREPEERPRSGTTVQTTYWA